MTTRGGHGGPAGPPTLSRSWTPPAAAAADPSFPWTPGRHYGSPSGPLFTLLTYALAPLGIVWTFWGLKTIVALAAGGCLALVWRCARLLGRPPLGAVVLVGLNPAWLVWAVGGGHNDTLMELLVLAALALALASRPALAGGAAVAAAAVKVPALLVLPFLALARGSSRRRLPAPGRWAWRRWRSPSCCSGPPRRTRRCWRGLGWARRAAS